VQRVSLKSKSYEAGNQQQSTGRDQAMREGHSGNPMNEPRTARKARRHSNNQASCLEG
jgi:hypothetical protein